MGIEIIDNPPRSAMVVTPHPDDAEGGCGGTMAKWIAEAGTEVVVVMCTNGDKGTSDREMAPKRLAKIREKEQRDASAYLGVKDVVFFAHPDGTLNDDLQFRGEVVRQIRRFKPELVFCIDPFRVASHTHRDHRMSGQVALDAAYTYAWSPLYFPEQITEEGLEPHQVSEAFLWGTEAADVYVNVEGYLEAKSTSLSLHVSQMRQRTPADRLERIERGCARQGEAAGLAYAEGFRRVRFDLGTLDWRLLNA
ncbi:MAG: PIG-L family deacetylase [Chloroflexota bacterium]|nr:PIG-L family deacetylase [Chloroflexota bacterium]